MEDLKGNPLAFLHAARILHQLSGDLVARDHR